MVCLLKVFNFLHGLIDCVLTCDCLWVRGQAVGVSSPSGDLGSNPRVRHGSGALVHEPSILLTHPLWGGSWRVVSHPFPDGGVKVQRVSLACGVHM